MTADQVTRADDVRVPARPGTADENAEPVTIPELYARERLKLVRLAVLLVDDRGTAEDVVHDAFAAVLRLQPEFADHDAATAYLRTAVLNRARSALRRRRTMRAVVLPFLTSQPAADEAVQMADEHRTVLAAVRRLPGRQREVLVLRYWSDLSEREIAEALGISPGTVKSSANRGLAALRKQLGHGDE